MEESRPATEAREEPDVQFEHAQVSILYLANKYRSREYEDWSSKFKLTGCPNQQIGIQKC